MTGRGRRFAWTVTVLGLLLIVGVVLSAAIGQFPVAVTEVVGAVLNRLGLHTSWAPVEELKDQALWQIRFPRIAMAVLVGATLAVAGCVMQAIFGNPLAEPGVVGVSSGAALGNAAPPLPRARRFGRSSPLPSLAAGRVASSLARDGAVASASSAEASSPSASRSAIGVLTATPSVPSGTRILPSVPSSTASTSMVALSVSISAITSPAATRSPSFFSHLARLPSVMVGDSAGMRISIGMTPPSDLGWFRRSTPP